MFHLGCPAQVKLVSLYQKGVYEAGDLGLKADIRKAASAPIPDGKECQLDQELDLVVCAGNLSKRTQDENQRPTRVPHTNFMAF